MGLENVPYSSVLSKSHNMFLKVIYSRSHYPITSSTTFNYVILSDYILISALVLVTQEIPIIVDSYLLVNYSTFMSRSPRPIVTQLDNNTFPTWGGDIFYSHGSKQYWPIFMRLMTKVFRSIFIFN